MSDIPKARRILMLVADEPDAFVLRKAVREALKLMHRKRPKFIHKPQYAKLDAAGEAAARRLRAKGISLNDIALRLHTNMGRVSTAINRKVTNGTQDRKAN